MRRFKIEGYKKGSRQLLQPFLLLVVDLKPEYNYNAKNAKKSVYSDIRSITIWTLRNATIVITRVVSIPQYKAKILMLILISH